MAFTINGTSGINLATQPLTGSLPDANAPSGSVIQVVQGNSYDTYTTNSSSTYIDTGSSVTITPSSATSKILVYAVIGGTGHSANDTQSNYKLLRNSTQIQFQVNGNAGNANGQEPGTLVFTILDSPATTSAVTYKTQFANRDTGTTYVQLNLSVSTIIAMEIAA